MYYNFLFSKKAETVNHFSSIFKIMLGGTTVPINEPTTIRCDLNQVKMHYEEKRMTIKNASLDSGEMAVLNRR